MKLNGSWKIVLSTAPAIIAASSLSWGIVRAQKEDMDKQLHETKKDLKEDILELKQDFKDFRKDQEHLSRQILDALKKN